MEEFAVLSNDPKTQDFLAIFFPEIDPVKYKFILNVDGYDTWNMVGNGYKMNTFIVNIKFPTGLYNYYKSQSGVSRNNWEINCSNSYTPEIRYNDKEIYLNHICCNEKGVDIKFDIDIDESTIKKSFSDLINKIDNFDDDIPGNRTINIKEIETKSEELSIVINKFIKIEIYKEKLMFHFDDKSKEFPIDNNIQNKIDQIVLQCYIKSIKHPYIKNSMQNQINLLSVTPYDDNAEIEKAKKRFEQTAKVHDSSKEPASN